MKSKIEVLEEKMKRIKRKQDYIVKDGSRFFRMDSDGCVRCSLTKSDWDLAVGDYGFNGLAKGSVIKGVWVSKEEFAFIGYLTEEDADEQNEVFAGDVGSCLEVYGHVFFLKPPESFPELMWGVIPSGRVLYKIDDATGWKFHSFVPHFITGRLVERIPCDNGRYIVRDGAYASYRDSLGGYVRKAVRKGMWDTLVATEIVETGEWVGGVWVGVNQEVFETTVNSDGEVIGVPNADSISIAHQLDFVEVDGNFLVPKRYGKAVAELYPDWVQYKFGWFSANYHGVTFHTSMKSNGHTPIAYHYVYGRLPVDSRGIKDVVSNIRKYAVVFQTTINVY